MKLIAKTLMGLEEVLAQELRDLGAEKVSIGKRVVSYEGDYQLLIRSTYLLRTAIRVLKPVYKFKFHSKKDFYNKMYRFNWINLFDNDQSFAIDAIVFSRFFNNSQYVAQFAKDGIVDYFTKKTGRRPNVELYRPDIRFHLHMIEDKCEISMDSSGFSLHKRSYKTEKAFAPLSEVLAAGMILLSGWDGNTQLVDPMCGSGTIPIEAAMIQRNIPAQLLNNRFCFQQWRDYDSSVFDAVKEEALGNVHNTRLNILASDILFRNVKSSQINADNVLTNGGLAVSKKDFFDYSNMENAQLIINPPYDLRLKNDDILEFYKRVGDQLKKNWKNSTAWILSGNIAAIKSIGLKTSKRIHLMNGQIPCKFHKFELYEGSKK